MSLSKQLLDDLSRTEPSEFEEEESDYGDATPKEIVSDDCGTFPATRARSG